MTKLVVIIILIILLIFVVYINTQNSKKIKTLMLEEEQNNLEIESIKNQIFEKNEKMEEMQKQMMNINKELNLEEENTKNLMLDHQDLIDEKNSLENDFKNLNKEKDDLNKQLNELNNQFKTLEKEHNYLEDEYDNLEKEHNYLEDEYDNLEKEHNFLEDEYDNLEKEHNFLESEHNEFELEHKLLQQEYDNLDEDYVDVKNKFIKVNDNYLQTCSRQMDCGPTKYCSKVNLSKSKVCLNKRKENAPCEVNKQCISNICFVQQSGRLKVPGRCYKNLKKCDGNTDCGLSQKCKKLKYSNDTRRFCQEVKENSAECNNNDECRSNYCEIIRGQKNICKEKLDIDQTCVSDSACKSNLCLKTTIKGKSGMFRREPPTVTGKCKNKQNGNEPCEENKHCLSNRCEKQPCSKWYTRRKRRCKEYLHKCKPAKNIEDGEICNKNEQCKNFLCNNNRCLAIKFDTVDQRSTRISSLIRNFPRNNLSKDLANVLIDQVLAGKNNYPSYFAEVKLINADKNKLDLLKDLSIRRLAGNNYEFHKSIGFKMINGKKTYWNDQPKDLPYPKILIDHIIDQIRGRKIDYPPAVWEDVLKTGKGYTKMKESKWRVLDGKIFNYHSTVGYRNYKKGKQYWQGKPKESIPKELAKYIIDQIINNKIPFPSDKWKTLISKYDDDNKLENFIPRPLKKAAMDDHKTKEKQPKEKIHHLDYVKNKAKELSDKIKEIEDRYGKGYDGILDEEKLAELELYVYIKNNNIPDELGEELMQLFQNEKALNKAIRRAAEKSKKERFTNTTTLFDNLDFNDFTDHYIM